ncbi:MAG: hypothetical protein CMC08_07940 [Flavobacteriaceae bacterium]|nr:hypothetical protein [Flavobacteriaceae bacterium]
MGKPKKCITVSAAKEIQKKWNDTRGREIDRAQGEMDTFEFTFSIPDLEEYIAYVKEEADKQRISSPGLRLYFAAYDDDKSSKATVFLCPSESEGNDSKTVYTIDPYNQNQGGWPPKKYE